jgi:hypothetical protein
MSSAGGGSPPGAKKNLKFLHLIIAKRNLKLYK